MLNPGRRRLKGGESAVCVATSQVNGRDGNCKPDNASIMRRLVMLFSRLQYAASLSRIFCGTDTC